MRRKSSIHNASVYRANPSKELGTVATVPSCTDVARMVGNVGPASDQAWLWPGRFPLGRVSALVAGGGLFGGRCVGKGWVTCDMAAHVSTGRSWPDGSPCNRGMVMLLNAHDHCAEVRYRLDGCGADVARIYRRSVRGMVSSPSRGIGYLVESLTVMPDCRLVVIDPAPVFVGRRLGQLPVAGLVALAERFRVAIVVVADRQDVRPSTVLGRAVAAVWDVNEDRANPDRRARSFSAVRGAGAAAAPLAFRITGEPAAVVWEPSAATPAASAASE